MGLLRTEGIVLNSLKLGEVDKIVTLYTLDRGKIQGVAKGARRFKNRFGSALEPFTHGTCHLFEKEGRTLHRLDRVDIVHSFHRLREDLQTIACASFMLDLLKQVTPPEETQPEVFRLLLTSFHQMEHRSEMTVFPTPDPRPPTPGTRIKRVPRFHDPSRPYRAVIDSFQLKLLCLSGYRPRLEKCVRCGSPVSAGKFWFSFAQGGIACVPCLQGVSGKMMLSGAALAFLRQVIRMPVSLLGRYVLADRVLKEVRDFLDAYSRFVLDKEISSHRFIRAYVPGQEAAPSPAHEATAFPAQPL